MTRSALSIRMEGSFEVLIVSRGRFEEAARVIEDVDRSNLAAVRSLMDRLFSENAERQRIRAAFARLADVASPSERASLRRAELAEQQLSDALRRYLPPGDKTPLWEAWPRVRERLELFARLSSAGREFGASLWIFTLGPSFCRYCPSTPPAGADWFDDLPQVNAQLARLHAKGHDSCDGCGMRRRNFTAAFEVLRSLPGTARTTAAPHRRTVLARRAALPRSRF